MEGSADQSLELRRRGEFNAQGTKTAVGTFAQLLFRRRLPGPLRPEPRFQGLLVLPSGKAPSRLLPNQGHMVIVTPAVPGILGRVIPQELELMRDERPHDLRHLLELTREIAQVLHRLE